MAERGLRVAFVAFCFAAPAAALAGPFEDGVAAACASIVAKDYKGALKQLDQAERAAPLESAVVAPEVIARMWYCRGLAEHLAGDKKGRSMDAWRQTLLVVNDFQWEVELNAEDDPQSLFEALRREVKSRQATNVGAPEQTGKARLFVDGRRVAAGDEVLSGVHLAQISCDDDSIHGAWTDFAKPVKWFKLCPDGVDPTVVVTEAAPVEDEWAEFGPAFGGGEVAATDAGAEEPTPAETPVVAPSTGKKAAQEAAAKKAAQEAAAKKAAQEAAAKKAAEDAAAKKAAEEAAAKKAAEEAAAKKAAQEAAAKKAAEDAAAKKAAEDAAARDAAAKKAAEEAAAKKAAEEAAAKKAAEVAAAKKAAQEAAAKKATTAAGRKAAEEAAARKAAEEAAALRAEQEAVAREAAAKKAAEEAAAQKAAEEAAARQAEQDAAADANGGDEERQERARKRQEARARRAEGSGGGSALDIALYSGGGAMIAGSAVLNFLVLNPLYADIEDARAAPDTLNRREADDLTARFNTNRYLTIGLGAGGALLIGGGLLLDGDIAPVVGPGQVGVRGRF